MTLLNNCLGTVVAEVLAHTGLQEPGQWEVREVTMPRVNPKDVGHAPAQAALQFGMENTAPRFNAPRSSSWVVGLVLAAAALAAVYAAWRASAEAVSGTPGTEAGLALTRGPFEVTVATSGLIRPFEVVDVGAQVSGQLSALRVKLGDRVEQGQPLAEIDDRVIRARLVQGEAAVENLRAQINAKQTQLAYARSQQTRMDTLSERSIVSRAQAEQAQSTATVLAAEVQALEAQLAGQEAALDGIRLDLSYARINAPVDGIVTAVIAQRGQTLNASQHAPVILRISRDRPLILVARVPEADVERVRAGMPVRFTLVGGSAQTFQGTVTGVMRAPTIVDGAVFYDAMIELNGEQHVFAFGRTVQALIVVDRLECAVVIPRFILPDDVVAGGTITATFRNQAGTVYTRILVLRALDVVNGAVACEEAGTSGIDPPDRVLKITTERARDRG
jgi:macrolide-specific efflux system membrane fusion protein